MHPMNAAFRWVSFMVLSAYPLAVQAWNDTGHMVVAEIAQRQLRANVKQEVSRLLAIGATQKTDSIATAACWADDFKTNQNGLWHYINYHFRTDGRPTFNIPEAENVTVIRLPLEVLEARLAKNAE